MMNDCPSNCNGWSVRLLILCKFFDLRISIGECCSGARYRLYSGL